MGIAWDQSSILRIHVTHKLLSKLHVIQEKKQKFTNNYMHLQCVTLSIVLPD